MTGTETGRFAAMVELMPESVILRRRDGRILAWNGASEVLYGPARDAVLGRRMADVLGDAAEAPGAIGTLDREGAWQGEIARPGPDGEPRIVELQWRPLRLDGEDQILETGRDITATRRAEAELRKSEHRYRNLFQAMAASFWELDFFPVGDMLYRLKKSGAVTRFDTHFAENPGFVREMMRATRVIDVNDQSVALFGRGDKAELLTSVEPFWPEASSPVFAGAVVAAVSGAPNFSTETILRRIDGQEFPALFTACFPPDTMNKGTLLIGVIDMSERVAAQEALARMQADMAHAARVSMLGELAASIAHEVNQPLGAIAANAAAGQRWLARDVPDLEEVRAITGRIAEDARRAADTISRVRAMASGAAPDPGVVAVNEVVGDAAIFLQHEIRQTGARLGLDLSPDRPLIHADHIQVQQVIANLMLNALQAMAGHAAPELTLTTLCDGPLVRITVADNGPGIAEAHLPRLFDSFFTTRPGGMGLGLAIARGIVGQSDGTLIAENGASGGARFVISLTRLPSDEAAHTQV